MRNIKSFALLALLISLSLAVFADTSTDATHAKNEVKPQTEEVEVETKDVAVEPQQSFGGCRYGCCGGWTFGGRCRYCCTSQAEANEFAATVEPQQRRGCRYGCCGSYANGQCSACCSKKMGTEEVKKEEAKDEVKPQTEEVEVKTNDVAVEPQQIWGGCRFGCCGGWTIGGLCRYCCSQAQAVEAEAVEANVVEPQQGGRGGCRYGCCGGWFRGRCRYCCTSQAEANEFAETVEPQQRRGCRYGCCGSYANGQCSACCSKKMGIKEEAKP